jgi:MFS family permease
MSGYALVIWAYEQKGTASSIAWLTACSYLPSVLFCFIAGTLADKWDKKKVMLTSDFVAALGTLTVLCLYSTDNLQIWHLYIINTLISLMNAFQNPASYVAVSLIAPKEQYTRVSGLQAFSNSLINIISPALATALLSFSGLKMILVLDLLTFGIAFSTLLFFIHIPPVSSDNSERKESFLKSCLDGLNFLKEHRALLQIILFFAFINLLAYLTGFGILPALILARTGDNQSILGMVSSSIGIGTLVGSVIVTAAKPAKRKTHVIFISLAVSFLLANILWAVGQNAWIWVFAAFAGNLPLPFLGANMTTIMRTKVPTQMQGRVFSTRDTLQFFTRPLGLFLSGILADKVFEPFMQSASPFQRFLSAIVGTGKGSGIAVMFLITGVTGVISSLISLGNPVYKELDS